MQIDAQVSDNGTWPRTAGLIIDQCKEGSVDNMRAAASDEREKAEYIQGAGIKIQVTKLST